MKKKRERGNIEKKRRRNIPVVNLKGKGKRRTEEQQQKEKRKRRTVVKKRILKGPWSAALLFLFTFGFSIFQKLMYKLLLLCSNSYDLKLKVNPLTPDQICYSIHCQPYNSCNVSSENLVLDLLIIPQLIFFFILITYLVTIVRKNSVLVTHGSYRVSVAHAVWPGLLVSAITISCML